MKEIFRIKKLFPALLVLLAVQLLPGSEMVTYHSGPGVPLHSIERLQKLERFLRDFFPRSPYPGMRLTIDVTKEGKSSLSPSHSRIEIRNADVESLSLEALSAAGSAMLQAWGKAPPGYSLPLFLAAAFRHRERNSLTAGRFLGRNRQLNSVEALLKAQAQPQLQRVLTLTDPDSDPAAAFWYDDHALLLYELLHRNGFKGSAAAVLPAAQKILKSSTLEEDISSLVWNSFRMRPADSIRKELDELLLIRLPRLDHNGELNGLYEDLHALKAVPKLRQHPMRGELLHKFALKVLQSSPRFPHIMRRPLREVHRSAESLSRESVPPLEAALARALTALENSYQLCRSREKALDEAALKLENPVVLLKKALLENSRPGKIPDPVAERFLQRWNEYYNSN